MYKKTLPRRKLPRRKLEYRAKKIARAGTSKRKTREYPLLLGKCMYFKTIVSNKKNNNWRVINHPLEWTKVHKLITSGGEKMMEGNQT